MLHSVLNSRRFPCPITLVLSLALVGYQYIGVEEEEEEEGGVLYSILRIVSRKISGQ